jgi:hypothetical protein
MMSGLVNQMLLPTFVAFECQTTTFHKAFKLYDRDKNHVKGIVLKNSNMLARLNNNKNSGDDLSFSSLGELHESHEIAISLSPLIYNNRVFNSKSLIMI